MSTAKTADTWYKEGIEHWFVKNDPKEALKCFSAAIQAKPRHYKSYAERGNMYRRLGNNQDALADVENSLRISQNANAYYIKTRILLALGKKAEAEECFGITVTEEITPEDGVSYFYKGAALFELGRKEEALVCYDETIKSNPNYLHAYNNKGFALSSLGRKEEALVCYDQALQVTQNYPEAHYGKGAALSDLGRKAEAIPCFDQAIKLSPNIHMYYLAKCDALSAIGKKEEALVCIDQAIKIYPLYSYYCTKGNILSELGRRTEAITCFNESIKLKNDYDSSHYGKALALYQLGKKAEAVPCFEQAIKLNPNYHASQYYNGICLYDLGRKEEALQCFESSVRLNPYSAYYYYKGKVLSDLGKHEEAIACFDESIKLKNDYDLCHYEKAFALYQLGRKTEAVPCFEQAIKLNPNYHASQYYNGICLYDLGKKEEALQCFENSVRLNPFYSYYYYKGKVLFDLGKHEEAITCFDESLKLNANYDLTHLNKGIALSSLGKHQEAITSLDEAIRLSPNTHTHHYYKGRALITLGKKEDALSCYDNCIRLLPDHCPYYYNKGLVLLELNRKEEALACFEQTIQKNLKYYNAYYGKGLCLNNLGKKEEALACYNELIGLDPTYAHAYNNKASILNDMGKKEEAISCYDEAIKVNPNCALYYCNKGKLLVSLERDHKALECFDKAYELTQGENSGEWLKQRHIDFINKTINQDRPALLKNLKELQEASVEIATISTSLKTSDEAAGKLQQSFTNLTKRKAQLTEEFISNLNRDYEGSSSTIDSSTSGQTLSEQSQLMTQMKEEMLTLKKQMLEYKAQVALRYGNAQAKAEVVKGFKELEKQNRDLYDYCKTLYWTALNLFGAYKSLSTGLVQGNIETNSSDTEKLLASGAQKMTSYGMEIAKGVAFTGDIVVALDKIIGALSETSRENAFNKRINTINKVVQNKFGIEEDISVNIGKLAIAITNARKDLILNLNPEQGPPSKLEQGTNWLNQKLDQLKSKVYLAVGLNNKDSNGAALALSDTMLFISYVCKNYDTVIEKNAPIDAQLVDMLKNGGFDGMLECVRKSRRIEDSEEISSQLKAKLMEGRRKLQEKLAKQTFKNKIENVKLTEYYDSFVRTFVEAYLTSEVIENEKAVVVDEKSPKIGVLSILVSFISVAKSRVTKSVESIDQLMKSEGMVSCAKRMKLVASSEEILGQLVSECAIAIVVHPAKQKKIVNNNEGSEGNVPIEDEVKDIVTENLRKKLSDVISSNLYSEVYDTPAAKLGNDDANRVIQLWVSEKIGGTGASEAIETQEKIQQEFINEITLKDKKDPGNESSCLNPCGNGSCQMF